MIPFWCLMPKGEKIRPKQEMDQLPLEVDQLPLEDFEKVELEFLFVKMLIVSFVKSWSLVGRRLDYGKKGGVF
jgi:hypothetical protein